MTQKSAIMSPHASVETKKVGHPPDHRTVKHIRALTRQRLRRGSLAAALALAVSMALGACSSAEPVSTQFTTQEVKHSLSDLNARLPKGLEASNWTGLTASEPEKPNATSEACKILTLGLEGFQLADKGKVLKGTVTIGWNSGDRRTVGGIILRVASTAADASKLVDDVGTKAMGCSRVSLYGTDTYLVSQPKVVGGTFRVTINSASNKTLPTSVVLQAHGNVVMMVGIQGNKGDTQLLDIRDSMVKSLDSSAKK